MSYAWENYKIRDVNALQNSVIQLNKLCGEISTQSQSINYVLKLAREYWISTGQDAESFAQGIQDCLTTLDQNIIPSLKSISNTANDLAIKSLENRRSRIDNQII